MRISSVFCVSALRFARGFSGNGAFRNVGARLQMSTTTATPTTNLQDITPLPPVGELTELSRLEIRVGRIVEISKHPEADSLYVEKVDLGEGQGDGDGEGEGENPRARTIVSGLVEFCTEADLLNRDVVVLCNLKPRAIKGITSHGMLLCASNKEHSVVDPIRPPSGSSIGELITFEGHQNAPIEAGNRASKAFAKVVDDLYVNDNGQATYKNICFMTSSGPCTSTVTGVIS